MAVLRYQQYLEAQKSVDSRDPQTFAAKYLPKFSTSYMPMAGLDASRPPKVSPEEAKLKYARVTRFVLVYVIVCQELF